MFKLIISILFIATSSNAFWMSGSQVNSVEIAPGAVILNADTSGRYVGNITASDGIATTGASDGEDISHALSLDESFEPVWTGIQTFTPSGTKDVIINTDSDSTLRVVGLSTTAGTFLCLDGSNNMVKCSTANSIALATDTTGNYVATATAGTNISITGSGSEDAAITVSTVSNPTFSTRVITPEVRSPATGGNDTLTLAPGGTTAFTAEEDGDCTAVGNLAAANFSGNHSGTSSGTNTGDQTITLTGDVTGSGTGSFAATIQANSVALTTDTTGNYVGTLVAGTGISTTGASSGEGIAHSVSVDQSFSPTWTGQHTFFGSGAYTGTSYILDQAGDPSTKQSLVFYTTTGMVPGDLSAVNFIFVDTANASGGQMAGLNVMKTGSGTNEVAAVVAGVGVFPVVTLTGTLPAGPEQAWLETTGPSYTDATTNFGTAATDSTLFDLDNDCIYVGNATTYYEIQVALATAASSNIMPTFAYSTASGFTTFSPNDGTAGFTRNGNINFDKQTIIDAGWAPRSVNGVSKYYIRICRTENTVVTDAVEDTIFITDGTVNQWEPTGTLTIQKIVSQGSATNTIAGRVQMSGVVSVHTTCDANSVGLFEMYDDSANRISLCVCEKTGAATYAWGKPTGGSGC